MLEILAPIQTLYGSSHTRQYFLGTGEKLQEFLTCKAVLQGLPKESKWRRRLTRRYSKFFKVAFPIASHLPFVSKNIGARQKETA